MSHKSKQLDVETYETVLDELADVLPGVGVGNLVDLVRIQPDFVFATFHDT
jgi:hypothetical protein